MKNTDQNILAIARQELTAAIDGATNGENRDRLTVAHFQISNRMTSSGGSACVQGRNVGRVKLSGPIFRDEANSESDLRNTIRHELAHIAVGPGHGHDAVWKREAKRMGCTGDRCHQMVVAQSSRRARFDWTVTCPTCGHELGTLRNRATVAKWIGNRQSRCCGSPLAARKVV
jgi:predicted SprT family Zn-dependent metalloprotease